MTAGSWPRPATSRSRWSRPSTTRRSRCSWSRPVSFRLGHTGHWAPEVAAWLNFAPDHLDVHADLAHYEAAKARIWADQGPDAVAVVNADDPVVAAHRGRARRRTFGFSGAETATVRDGHLVVDDRPLIAVADLRRGLPHDLANALAAALDGRCRRRRATRRSPRRWPPSTACPTGCSWWASGRGALVRRLEGHHPPRHPGRGRGLRLRRAHRRRPQQGPRPARPARRRQARSGPSSPSAKPPTRSWPPSPDASRSQRADSMADAVGRSRRARARPATRSCSRPAVLPSTGTRPTASGATTSPGSSASISTERRPSHEPHHERPDGS